MAIYIELGALIVVILIVYLMIRFLKNPALILTNSIIGIVILFALDYLFHLGIPINLLSFIVVALGGVPGIIFILLLHFLGLGF
jgi:hypothetical protein